VRVPDDRAVLAQWKRVISESYSGAAACRSPQRGQRMPVEVEVNSSSRSPAPYPEVAPA